MLAPSEALPERSLGEVLPGPFRAAFLSGTTALVVSGSSVTAYDATTGAPGSRRPLPPGSTVTGFQGGILVYTRQASVHVLRLADGRDRTVATAPGLVDAQLGSLGLFYGYNVPRGGAKPGRVAFVPAGTLTKLLG